MGRMTQTAIALRIARRSVKRNRLQSALIIAIIALPMVLASGAAVYSASQKATGEELVRYELGSAAARFQVMDPPDTHAYQLPRDTYLSYGSQGPQNQGQNLVEIGNALPRVPLLKVENLATEFKTATGVGAISIVVGESWNSAFLNQGPAKLISGHVPIGTVEALVSPDALSRFGVSVGGFIETADGQKLKVSGVFSEASKRPLEDIVYVRHGAIQGLNVDRRSAFYYQLSGKAPTWLEVQGLNKQGIVVVSRSVLLNPPPANQTMADEVGSSVGRVIAALLLAPLVLLPVIVLAGSAFAFGARRQTRTLAVLSSLGAERKILRRVTIASGVWLGLIGGLIGTLVGLGGVYLFGSALADWMNGAHYWSNFPGFHVPWPLLALALIASVVLGAATSLVPAIKASKVNVLATLRGMRAEGSVKLRSGIGAVVLLILGVGAIAGSLALLVSSNGPTKNFQYRQLMQTAGVLLGIGGAIVTIISFMVATGWILVFVRKVMSWFGSTANFAGKDLNYNRKRYAPVVASVLTVTFVASFIGSFFYGPTKYNSDTYAYRFLPGQAGLSFGVSPGQVNQGSQTAVSPKVFWESVPKRSVVNSQRKLIQSTGAFDSVTVIDSTVDVFASGSAQNSDGSVAKGFDVPLPVIAYNPEAMCYYTGLSPKSQKWLLTHAARMTLADMKQPAGCAGLDDPSRTIAVGDARELRAILKGVDSNAESTLSRGGVVLFNRAYNYSGRAKLSWIKPSDYNWSGHNLNRAFKTEVLPSYVVGKITSNSFAYGAFISRETAAKYGIQAYPMMIVANYHGEVPAATTDQLNSRNLYLEYSNGTGILNPETFAWFVILFAGVFSLAATGIALGLSQIEARTDKRTLSAIGAPRAFRANLVSIQALSLTLIGSLLGVGTGLMLGAAMLNGMDSAMAQFPWVQLAVLVFGVPSVAALAFWLLTPRSLKYEVRQALD
jgi:putative ABC transport system permease protein